MSKSLISLFLIIQIILFSKEREINSLKKTLVLLDDWHNIDTHSLFWSQIKKMNFELDFRMIDDPSIKLTDFGEYIYTNIIYFSPSISKISRNEISIQNLLKFIDEGHDMLIFGNKDSGTFIRNLVNEFGVDFDDYDSQVKDSLYLHTFKNELNEDLINLNNDEIVITNNTINVNVITKKPKGQILFEGIGMDLDPQNKYIFPILKANDNSYSINVKTGEVYSNGERIKLVSGYQTRNNQRIVISGSLNLCSDKFYYLSNFNNNNNIENSPNYEFCQDILNWNFQRTGVLKFDNIRHNRKDDKVTLSTYRIKDELEYFIDIYEYDYINNNWKPYITNDLQLEYVMMNPYYINQLKQLDKNKPTYYVKFKAPEKFGVFKFIIDYHRIGYSYIISETKVPLRPFNHNEFPRFLTCAYPYYTSVFVMVFSWILFSFLFLYGKKKVE
jgi:oligosaccharyltransferase complex subunit beta